LYRPPCCLAKPDIPADSGRIAASVTLGLSLTVRLVRLVRVLATSLRFIPVQNPGQCPILDISRVQAPERCPSTGGVKRTLIVSNLLIEIVK